MITFPKHATHKDSGLNWLGEIPEDWNLIRAKYVLREIDERSTTGDEELLSVSHLTGVTPRSEKNVNMFLAEDYSGSKLCRPNDLVINTMWAWMGALGVSPVNGIVSPAYGVYRPYGEVYPRFLDRLLRTPQYIAEYIRRSTGIHSSRLRLYPEQFLDIPLLLPSLKEQKRIVEFLDRKIAEIDEAIAHKQRLIELLQEQKAIVINQAVTKGLNLNTPMCHSGVNWIGEIPKNWNLTKFNRIAFFQEGPGLRNWQFKDEGIKVICVSNICPPVVKFEKLTRFISEQEYKARYRHFTVQKGDLLLASSGASWGKIAEYTMDETVILNTSTIRVNSLRDRGVSRDFIRYILQAQYISTHLSFLLTGSCQPNFGPSHLNKLICVFPEDIIEQEEIVSHIENNSEKIDALIKSENAAIKKLEEFKNILVAQIVTGKMKV